jgi:hypothetical protein
MNPRLPGAKLLPSSPVLYLEVLRLLPTQSAFENNAEPEFIEKTIKTFVQAVLLDFTETNKVHYTVA